MEGVRKAIDQRVEKSSPVLFSALTESLDRDMKIIDLKGWTKVAKAMDTLAKRKAEWFPQGFNGIHAVSNPEFFAATREGAIYFSNADELIAGFKPASLLAQAMEKAKVGEALSFYEEYAVEMLWHEMIHGITCIKTGRVSLELEPLTEGVVQLIARHTYIGLMAEIGALSNHQASIIANGLAYPNVTGNLIALIKAAGLQSQDIADALLDDPLTWESTLIRMIGEPLQIRPSKVRYLLNKAENMPTNQFKMKINVQTMFQRNKGAS